MSTQVKITRERTSEGPTSSVRTETYETSTRTSYDTEGPTYRALVQPRTTIIQRTMAAPARAGASSVRMERSMQYGAGPQIDPAAYAAVTATGVTNVKTSREQEKKDIKD